MKRLFLAWLFALVAASAHATVSTSTYTTTITGNGTQTVFNYGFLIPYQADGVTPAATVQICTTATGACNTLANTAYSISGVGNVTGGTVTYDPSSTPIPSTETITISRSLAYTQPYAVSNQSFYPHTVEQSADSLELQLQQINGNNLNLAQVGTLGAASSAVGTQLPCAIIGQTTPAQGCTPAEIVNAANVAFYSTFPVLASNCTNTTIQSAINAAAANGGGIVLIPVGVCTIAANLTVNNSYIGFKCVGPDGIHTGTVVPTACSLKWTGASGGTIMTISAPTGSTSDSFLTGISIEGITFDGNAGLAANALTLQSMRNSRFQNLYAQSFNGGYVFYIGTVHATTSNFGDSCDTQFNLFDNISINQFSGSSIGIYLDAWLNASYENDGCGGTFNTFRNIDMGTSSGQGLVFHGADNNQFYNVRIYDTVNTVRAVEFTIASGGGITYPANSNVIYHISTNALIYADGQSTNPGCVAYTSSFQLTSCTQANAIYDIDVLDGTQAPTVEPGAQLLWSNTTGAKFNAQSGPLAIGGNVAQATAAAGAIGNASLQINNAAQDHIVLMDGTETWGVNINATTENLKFVRGTGSATAVEMPGALFTPAYPYGSGLPTCNAASAGQVIYVTGVAAPTYHGSLSSGSTNTLALCNGTSYVAN